MNPVIDAGAVTVIGPQPEFTTGADDAVGNITTLTVLLGPHEPAPAEFAAVLPHADVRTYLAMME